MTTTDRRILGLDFGTRRVGAALSDPRRLIATPLEVYERRSPERDARHYREVIETEGVDRIVVGLPLHTGGGEGESARSARDWGAWIARETGLIVVFFDERYTTADAEAVLKSQGLRLKDRKAKRDMLAARLLLQNYLDAGCPETEAPALPIEDAPCGEP
jgi:putative Holliday junction resolvase